MQAQIRTLEQQVSSATICRTLFHALRSPLGVLPHQSSIRFPETQSAFLSLAGDSAPRPARHSPLLPKSCIRQGDATSASLTAIHPTHSGSPSDFGIEDPTFDNGFEHWSVTYAPTLCHPDSGIRARRVILLKPESAVFSSLTGRMMWFILFFLSLLKANRPARRC